MHKQSSMREAVATGQREQDQSEQSMQTSSKVYNRTDHSIGQN